MKANRVVILGLIFSISAFIAGCQKNEETPSTSQAVKETQEVIKLGATGQSYPNSFVQDGKLVGFDVEVAEAIANKIGAKVEWTKAEFSGLMGLLDSERLDSVANVVAITEAREQKFNFTEPYSYLGSQVVTHTNNTDINDHQDLVGKTVSGVLGSNNVAVLQKAFPNGEVILRTYETRDGAMHDLVAQRVDGYINSKPILLAEIKRNNLPFKMVGAPLAMERVGFPFHKNAKGEKLRDQFNAALKTLQDDGTIKAISIKYFGEDISIP